MARGHGPCHGRGFPAARGPAIARGALGLVGGRGHAADARRGWHVATRAGSALESPTVWHTDPKNIPYIDVCLFLSWAGALSGREEPEHKVHEASKGDDAHSKRSRGDGRALQLVRNGRDRERFPAAAAAVAHALSQAVCRMVGEDSGISTGGSAAHSSWSNSPLSRRCARSFCCLRKSARFSFSMSTAFFAFGTSGSAGGSGAGIAAIGSAADSGVDISSSSSGSAVLACSSESSSSFLRSAAIRSSSSAASILTALSRHEAAIGLLRPNARDWLQRDVHVARHASVVAKEHSRKSGAAVDARRGMAVLQDSALWWTSVCGKFGPAPFCFRCRCRL